MLAIEGRATYAGLSARLAYCYQSAVICGGRRSLRNLYQT